jgi:hypothetical protein
MQLTGAPLEPVGLPTALSVVARQTLASASAGDGAAGRPDPALAVVARSLRSARARTGMNEQQVVAKLAEDGFAITVARLRAWERTGVIRVDAAARLADAYGITMDALSGRRAYGTRRHAG